MIEKARVEVLSMSVERSGLELSLKLKLLLLSIKILKKSVLILFTTKGKNQEVSVNKPCVPKNGHLLWLLIFSQI